MKHDAMLLVNAADEIAVFAPEDAFQGAMFGCHDVDLDLAGPQRGGDFKPDEACADDYGMPGLLCPGNDRARVGKRAQDVHMRLIRARDIEANGLGAGREQQLVEWKTFSSCKRHLPRSWVDAGDLTAKPQIYALLAIVVRRPQRHPIFRRVSSEIILGAIGPIVRRALVSAQHDQAAGKSLAAKHLRCGKACRAAADDDDPAGLRSGKLRSGRPGSRGLLDLLAHECFPVATLDPKARHGIERRRGDCFTRAQAETGMM